MKMTKEISLGKSKIGPQQPCFLIAEVGTTCLGDVDKAFELITAAKLAGMDAVKFQVIDPEQISDRSTTYPMVVDGVVSQVNMYEMFKRLSFSESQWQEVANKCLSEGLQFFATVDYLEGVEMLDRLGVVVHKIGAWDATYFQLVQKIGQTGKPIFVDLGPTTENEVEDLVRWYCDAGGPAVLFMHDFHTLDDMQMNLRTISLLNERYEWPAGFSSPARDADLDVAALALGAAYIEKRLVLRRDENALHAHESLDPAELKEWVDRIRHVERALGVPCIQPSSNDLEGKAKYYRSVCTLKDVAAGDVFELNNLGAKRPGTGIPMVRLAEFLGKKAMRDIPSDTLLSEADVQ